MPVFWWMVPMPGVVRVLVGNLGFRISDLGFRICLYACVVCTHTAWLACGCTSAAGVQVSAPCRRGEVAARGAAGGGYVALAKPRVCTRGSMKGITPHSRGDVRRARGATTGPAGVRQPGKPVFAGLGKRVQLRRGVVPPKLRHNGKGRRTFARRPLLALAAIYSRGTCRPTTIDVLMFHFRVRNGTGWGHQAVTTRFRRVARFALRRVPGGLAGLVCVKVRSFRMGRTGIRMAMGFTIYNLQFTIYNF